MRTSPFHRFPPLPILFLAVFVDMVGFGIVLRTALPEEALSSRLYCIVVGDEGGSS
jgi:hypothetical protein